MFVNNQLAPVVQWVDSTQVFLLSTYRYANTRASGFAFRSGRSLWSLCYCPWFALITRGSCWPSSSRWSWETWIALDKRWCTWDPGFTLFSLLATGILKLSWWWKAKKILQIRFAQFYRNLAKVAYRRRLAIRKYCYPPKMTRCDNQWNIDYQR